MGDVRYIFLRHTFGVFVGEWVGAHGPRLGVVVRTVEVEVAQVLGRVLADAQVARGDFHLVAADAALPRQAGLEVARVVVALDELFRDAALSVPLVVVILVGVVVYEKSTLAPSPVERKHLWSEIAPEPESLSESLPPSLSLSSSSSSSSASLPTFTLDRFPLSWLSS